MPVNLFLDANIFLSFYALSNADISSLTELGEVVGRGDIKLFVNEQLQNEIERNRENKISEAFKALRGDTFKCHAPSFVRSMSLFSELQQVLLDANKKHADLVTSVEDLIKTRQLEADKVVSELLSKAEVSPNTDDLYNAARKRFLIGNPPGKKKVTIGDEMNWEFLLEKVPHGEDLHLVSLDGDYTSATDPEMANSFLQREWNDKKESKIHLYKDLNKFFKLHAPRIKLENQAKLNALIAELSGSGSFTATHSIIAKFPENPDFNDAQIMELINIKNNNSQVGWIEGDTDMSAFYGPINRRYADIIKETSSIDESA